MYIDLVYFTGSNTSRSVAFNVPFHDPDYYLCVVSANRELSSTALPSTLVLSGEHLCFCTAASSQIYRICFSAFFILLDQHKLQIRATDFHSHSNEPCYIGVHCPYVRMSKI